MKAVVFFLLFQSSWVGAQGPILEAIDRASEPLKVSEIDYHAEQVQLAAELQSAARSEALPEYLEIFQFNLKAQTLWSSLPGDDFGTKRIFYLKNSMAAVGSFRRELRDFLKTTQFSNRTNVPQIRLHPLVAQSLLEFLSEVEIYPTFDKIRATKIQENFQKNFVLLKNTVRWLSFASDRHCDSWGLWPQASTGVLWAISKNSEFGMWSSSPGFVESRQPDLPTGFTLHAKEMADQGRIHHNLACLSGVRDRQISTEFQYRLNQGQRIWWAEVVLAFRSLSKRYR
jgi:hypothetical protein